MRCFTIIGCGAIAGIQLANDMLPSVAVGKTGRGSTRVLAPLPDGAVVEARGDNPLVQPGRLCEIQGCSAVEAVILIEDHSGFRGSWWVRDARTAEEWDLVIRRAAAHRPAVNGGAVAGGHECDPVQPGCRACDREVGPKPIDRPPVWRLVAEGRCAQGAAGRMGGGPEYLAVLESGRAIEIVRSGRLYGSPDVVKITNNDGNIVVSDPRQEADSRMAQAAWR